MNCRYAVSYELYIRNNLRYRKYLILELNGIIIISEFKEDEYIFWDNVNLTDNLQPQQYANKYRFFLGCF